MHSNGVSLKEIDNKLRRQHLKKTISFFVLAAVSVCILCGCDAQGAKENEEADMLLYNNGLAMIGPDGGNGR